MKKCTCCEVEKDLTEFWKRTNRSSGSQTICKDCQNAKRRERFKDPEKYRKKRNREKDWYKKNREKMIAKVSLYQQNLSEEKKDTRRELRRLAFKNSQEQKRKKMFYLQNIYDKKKINANQKLNDALRYGKITRPENCQICNEKMQLDGHHADYDKPLDVIWVCRKCHMEIHKQRKHNASNRN